MRLGPGFALSIIPALLLACGGGDSGDSGDDAPPGNSDADVDAAPPADHVDAAPSGGDVDGALPGRPDAAPPAATCGSAQPDVSRIRGTEGLAIGPDGTIYFSQSGRAGVTTAGVGRLRPGQAIEPLWTEVKNPAGGTVWGLALTSTHLYVGYRTGRSIWRVDLATGAGEEWLTAAGEPNGVIIGADGALYYSDFGGSQVYRVDLASKRRTPVITGARLLTPNGLYSLDATHLLVLAYNAADVVELTLANGVETSRRVVADLDHMAGIRLDGITRDAQGRWYLSDNRNGAVIRRPSNFARPSGAEESLDDEVSSPANLVFGRGALSCADLYVTSGAGMRRITID